MSSGLAIELMNHAVMLALMVAAPLLVTALLVGVLISLLQALTQIQEQTLTFIPKLVALAIVFLIAMPWMVRQLVDYLAQSIDALPGMVG
jgi:flagellar biosynthetic protein FliQ